MKGARPLTDQEIQKTIDKLAENRYGKRDVALFITMLYTGFRIHEIVSIKMKDIYRYEKVVDRLTVEKKFMKGKKESRTVFLHKTLKKYVLDYLHDFEGRFKIPLKEDYPLFISQKKQEDTKRGILVPKGLTERQVYGILNRAFASLEMTGKLGCHSTRKTYCDRIHKLLDNDLMKTRDAMGHRDLKTTQAYLSFDTSEIDGAIEALDFGIESKEEQ